MKAINIKGTEKLTSAIEAAEGRAKMRRVSAEFIRDVLERVEREVPTKKALVGTKVHYTGAERFPRAYKYTAESTHFDAEYTASGWKVTDIYRAVCPNGASNVTVSYSSEAVAKILESKESFRV